MKINTRDELIAKQKEYAASLNSQRKQILICAGTGCVAGGSLQIYDRMKEIIEEKGLRCALVLEKEPHDESIGLKKSGCHGFCEMGPLLRIEPMGWLYLKVKIDDLLAVLDLYLQIKPPHWLDPKKWSHLTEAVASAFL